MTKLIKEFLNIEDIMEGAALEIFDNYILDWSQHNKTYAIRTIGDRTRPKGNIIFISKSEFQRIKDEKEELWANSVAFVEDYLSKL